MRILLFVFCCCLQLTVVAQQPYPVRYDLHYNWKLSPDIQALKKEATSKDATILRDYRIIEYTVNEAIGKFEFYYTRHLQVYINSDKAIEQYNRIAIPLHDMVRISAVRARTISPSGKITILDRENDFKQVENYENNGPYMLFAFQGAEPGCVVEYIYSFQKKFKLNGTELFNSRYPVAEAEVTFLSPEKHFTVAYSQHNAEFVDLSDSLVPFVEKRAGVKLGYSLKGRPDESYSPGTAGLPRIEYRMVPEREKTATNEMTWEKIGRSIWENIGNQEKSDFRATRKLGKKLLLQNGSPEEKVRTIENYLKKNIQYDSRSQSEDADHPRSIIARKTASAIGLVRMYVNLSQVAGVNCQVVLTLSRKLKTFDPAFASYGYLHEYVIYFPELDTYLSPTDYTLRYGFIPDELTCQQGLFLRQKSSYDPDFAYELKPLVCHTWDKTLSNSDATVRFDLDAGAANVTYQHTYTGYSAANKQDYKLVLSGEQKQNEYILSVLNYYSGKNEPKNIVVTGNTEADLCRNPFILKMDYSSEQLLEKAGTKYIFHIGELIGPQSQLYRDTLPRQNWIENEHNRGYVHKLVIEIPEGYKVTNPDAVKFDVKLGPDNDEVTRFHSWYTMEGNKLIVEAKETYGTIRYPKEDWEAFRKVVNAAADFNKVVLYLEKQ